MKTWEPIGEEALLKLIRESEGRMSPGQRRIWDAIQIEPRKWKQEPWGDEGGGFWVVALCGRTVVWYNDIEEGFNHSLWHDYGVIDEYWCNQDRLEWTMEQVSIVLSQRIPRGL